MSTIRPLLLLVVTGILPGCISPHLDTQLSGRIIDGESGAPVRGAVVALHRTAHCARLADGYTRYLSPREVQTDNEGRFTIGGRITFVDCLSTEWIEELRILAPGYFPEFLQESQGDFKKIAAGPITLDRWRYLADFLPYRRPSGPDKQNWTFENAGPAWRKGLTAIQAAPLRALGPAGVFRSEPSAAFDQIAATLVGFTRNWRNSTVILARDRATNTLQAWSMKGTKDDLLIPPGQQWSAIAVYNGLGYPVLVAQDRLHYVQTIDFSAPRFGVTAAHWATVPSQRGIIHTVTQSSLSPSRKAILTLEGGRRHFGVYDMRVLEEPLRRAYTVGPVAAYPISDLLAAPATSVECMAGERTLGKILVIAARPQNRVAYLLQFTRGVEQKPLVERATLPPGTLESEVTACCVGSEKIGGQPLYLAFKDGRILKFLFQPTLPPSLKEDPKWRGDEVTSLRAHAGVQHFLGLAATDYDDYHGVREEVLFAVAGDGAIYRFASDGTPDQRVELEGLPSE